MQNSMTLSLLSRRKPKAEKLSIIGGSFSEVKSSTFLAALDLSVAGRLRRPADSEAPDIRISIHGPDNAEDPQVDFTFRLEDSEDGSEDAVQYDEKVGAVFAFRGPVFLQEPGLYTLKIYVNGTFVRRLAFEALCHNWNPINVFAPRTTADATAKYFHN
ncbi:hypothetical protein [Corynebacterium aquilae]|uniref:hypothetical protein n=1 Tax=Corynebacterium aquilae TaxID=203263 RepID=UPI001475C02D|nr:hypothetical protein [Corynebacterium aquilae]